jgi:acyl transferase domain-containing protein
VVVAIPVCVGTAAGDPVEANWVGDAFHPGRLDELLIGSVKGNIGSVFMFYLLSVKIPVLI